MQKSLIESMNWRFAINKFDSSRKVSKEDIDELLEIVRLSPSSVGLQAYKLLVIEDKELREKLVPASGKQAKVAESSHLIVFCSFKQVSEEYIDNHFDMMARERKQTPESLLGFKNSVKKYVAKMTEQEQEDWLARQAYIALGILLEACAVKEIDSCPMEGFDPGKYDEILGLSAKNMKAVVLAAIGYRADDDDRSNQIKVRKAPGDLLEFI